VVAVKAGKAKKKLVLEPHDIVKELRLLSSLSHSAVRLHILLSLGVAGIMFTCGTDHLRFGP
jgi:ABC-type glucose/galactose transport system permease subunit